MNTKKLSDKVALVTGGTSGIGKTESNRSRPRKNCPAREGSNVMRESR